ncbi:MAG: LapA family protein [Pseudomonadota bacterium]
MAKTIVFCLLLAFMLVFVIQNTQVISFQFLFWKVSMSRALLLLLSFGIGIIVGVLLKRSKPKKS